MTVGLEPTSASSMVVTPHCGDHSLSVEKAADDKQVEPTSVRSMVVRSPWSGLPSPFRKRFIQTRVKRFLNHKALASVHGCKR